MAGESELEGTARSLLALAERTQLTESADALMLAASAAAIARAIPSSALELEAERLGARIAYAQGDLARAERSFSRAAGAARALGDALAAARLDASLAFLAYDRGEPGIAHDKLDAVLSVLDTFAEDDAGALRLRALVGGYRGNLARQAGALDDARARYAAALELAEASDAPVPRATFAMDLGATELAAGRHAEAALWLARSSRALDAVPLGSSRALLGPLIAHYRSLLLLGSAGRADDPRSLVDIGGPSALLPIRTWLFDATRGGTEPARMDLALTRRLERLRDAGVPFEHARFGAVLLGRLAGDPVRGETILVARDGSLIVKAGAVSDLGAREPLRLILEALVRTLESGDPLMLARLVAIGWPRERMRPEAAKNRAHVALSTLRSLGLGSALVRDPRGYSLDPARVRVAT